MLPWNVDWIIWLTPISDEAYLTRANQNMFIQINPIKEEFLNLSGR